MQIGDRLDSYVLQECIGQGGFGSVWKASRLDGRGVVAIKELRREWGESRKIVKRFRNEYRILRELDHPHVVNPIDFLELPEVLAIVMAYESGGSLNDRLQRVSWLPVDTVLSVTVQIACALEATEKLGIVHRDVKPANVLFADDSFGHAKLTDFGVAHLPNDLLSSSRPTTHPEAIGTLLYMSPEQLNAEELDSRSDIYSLGMTLYKALTGRLFFDVQMLGPIDIQSAISRPFRTAPSRYRPDLPEWLDDLVLHMIAFDTGSRPRNARDVVITINQHQKV